MIVDDREKALEFYTGALGFVKKNEIPMGEYKWFTVVSPDNPDGVELVLEPSAFAPAKTCQQALFEAGIPITSFAVDNIQNEHQRLSQLGVVFRGEPAANGPVWTALLEDTCGNLIQLYQVS